MCVPSGKLASGSFGQEWRRYVPDSVVVRPVEDTAERRREINKSTSIIGVREGMRALLQRPIGSNKCGYAMKV